MTTLTETTVKPKIVVELSYDGDVENPSSEDGQWKHISFSTKHINFQHPDDFFHLGFENDKCIGLVANEAELAEKLAIGTAFILSYFEHGNGVWSLKGEGPQCQFDTAQYAGLLLWEHPIEDFGATTYEDRANDARSFLKTYSDWCNGHGLRYAISLFAAADTIDEDGEAIDIEELVADTFVSQDIGSCCGFYAHDENSMLEAVQADIACLLQSENTTIADYDIVITGDAGTYVSVEQVTPATEIAD